MEPLGRHRGCLLGLACGDAVGTTVEFKPRGSFPPVTDMVGGGPFNLPRGAWTDDTSMALCLATSLVECSGFDALDQMKRYCRWEGEGYLSSIGRCFDIGITTRQALERFRRTAEPYSGTLDPRAAGNGCIMRLAPVPIFYHADAVAAVHWAGESSRTTHAAVECVEASQLFAAMLVAALQGADRETVLFGHRNLPFTSPKVQALAEGKYRPRKEQQIKGTGYVIDCLEAAAWCFLHSNSFEEAVLRAVNLGDDADTTGAVCGQLAGAFHGEAAIPQHWREQLVFHEEIVRLADLLAKGERLKAVEIADGMKSHPSAAS